jgi:hypothetical protein
VYPPDDTWRLPPASRSPPRGPGPPGGCCGRPIVRCVSTERAKIQRTSGIGAFCHLSRKTPFVVLTCSSITELVASSNSRSTALSPLAHRQRFHRSYRRST